MAKHGDERTGNLVCSFCGKSQDEVRKLIAGPTVYICDECIDLCNDIIAEECDQEEGLTSTSSVKDLPFGQSADRKSLSMTCCSQSSGRALRLRISSSGAVTFIFALSPTFSSNRSLTNRAKVEGMNPLKPTPFISIML